MRYIRIGCILLAITALLCACATQPPPTALNPPGFWSGCCTEPLRHLPLLPRSFQTYEYTHSQIVVGGMILAL